MASDNGNLILRHLAGERVSHWAIAIAFIFLFLSGLAMFHPIFFWLSGIFGGGQFMRLLHPFAGVMLVLLFYPYAARVWKDNDWTPADNAWVKNMFVFMEKRHHPQDTGKYNGGQKLIFWSMVPIVPLLLITGMIIWQPWFAPVFPPLLRRIAGLLHAFFSFIMFVVIGIHWYAAYWTRGSIQSMVRGTVTRRRAQFHHPSWYRDITGGSL